MENIKLELTYKELVAAIVAVDRTAEILEPGNATAMHLKQAANKMNKAMLESFQRPKEPEVITGATLGELRDNIRKNLHPND